MGVIVGVTAVGPLVVYPEGGPERLGEALALTVRVGTVLAHVVPPGVAVAAREPADTAHPHPEPRCLVLARCHIQALEDRLSATGTDVSLTLQSMQEQLGTNVTEIDKLWAVAYRQNRPKIQALEKSIDTTITELNAQLDPIANTVGGLGGRFEALNKGIIELQKTLSIENDDQATQIALLRQQLQDQVDAFEKSRRKLDLVSQQLGDAREDIRSNLEYRARNNTDMLEMKRQIQSLSTIAVQ